MKKMLWRQYSVARSHAFPAVTKCPACAAERAFSSVASASLDQWVNQSPKSPGATRPAVARISPRSAEAEFTALAVRWSCASNSGSSRKNFMARKLHSPSCAGDPEERELNRIYRINRMVKILSFLNFSCLPWSLCILNL
jgi:hypothetical protein